MQILTHRPRFPAAALGLALLAACGGGAGPGSPVTTPVTPTGDCAPPPASTHVVDVRDYGAKGDGVSDDTRAIQGAINAVAGSGGTLRFPAGTYPVNPVAAGSYGLVVQGAMSLSLDTGAVLQAIPNGAPNSCVLAVSGASQVTIVGGAIVGDRAAHTGSSGEWGMGLSIDASSQVVVQGLAVSECWGDGFYISGGSRAVTLCGVTADHNRRNGLSIVAAQGVLVTGSTFRNTAGTAPEAGIDCEPNPGATVDSVQVTGCTLSGNHGGGFGGGPAVALLGQAWFTRSTISNCTVSGNNLLGIEIAASDGNAVVGNLVTGTAGDGIVLTGQATDTAVTGNTCSGNTGNGISLDQCAGSVVSGNACTGNGGYGIDVVSGCGATVSGNTLSDNGRGS